MSRPTLIGLFVLLSLLPGCKTAPLQVAPSTSLNPTVTHVVVCWLKNPGNDADRQRAIDASARLSQIPGVLSVRAGRVLPSTRPVVDSSYDVALVITFDNVESLRAYDDHPIHQSIVADVIRPLVQRYVIYDFVNP